MKALRLPRAVLFSFPRGESPFTGSTFVAVDSLPLPDGGARRPRFRAAAAEQQEEYPRLALQVGLEVKVALLILRSAGQNVRTACTAVTAAAEDYRVASLRRIADKRSKLEALDALATQLRAQNQLARAPGLRSTREAGNLQP